MTKHRVQVGLTLSEKQALFGNRVDLMNGFTWMCMGCQKQVMVEFEVCHVVEDGSMWPIDCTTCFQRMVLVSEAIRFIEKVTIVDKDANTDPEHVARKMGQVGGNRTKERVARGELPSDYYSRIAAKGAAERERRIAEGLTERQLSTKKRKARKKR